MYGITVYTVKFTSLTNSLTIDLICVNKEVIFTASIIYSLQIM